MSLDTVLKRTFRIDKAESDDSVVLSVTNLRDEAVTDVTVQVTVPENMTADKSEFAIAELASQETVELGEFHTRSDQTGEERAYTLVAVCWGTTAKNEVDRERLSVAVKI